MRENSDVPSNSLMKSRSYIMVLPQQAGIQIHYPCPGSFLPVFIGTIFEVVLLIPLTNEETSREPLAKDHPSVPHHCNAHSLIDSSFGSYKIRITESRSFTLWQVLNRLRNVNMQDFSSSLSAHFSFLNAFALPTIQTTPSAANTPPED